ncbi:hypothetical protein ECDEC9E_0664 [Escherichia coli DEC9E]|nr:hypothetical protein ECDEC9E_0664 [Escherichia coli DEC9E]
MFTTTVVLLRFAFSWIVQFCTGFPVPSFSTPEIFTAIFTHKKARLNRRAVITLCYLANQNL